MTEWTFDLAQETNPIKRLGIHGLWRLLNYGSGKYADYYPDVRQSATLRWEIGPTRVKLYWETVDDLNRLMGCQLGDFRNGVGVVPGYQPERDKPGFYATARSHLGICGTYFFAMRGGRRSESLAPPKPAKEGEALSAKDAEKKAKKEALYRTFLAANGEPVRKVAHLPATNSTEAKPSFVEITVSPHVRSTEPPALEAAKRGLAAGTFGSVYHPAFAKWNDSAVKGYPEELFIVSFSCLSYVFTQATSGTVGVGIDFSTFVDADAKHELWAADNDPRGLLWVDGDSRTAAWFIAAVLCLPPRTYSVLTPEGALLFSPVAPTRNAVQVYAALSAAVLPRDKGGLLRGAAGIPTRMHADGKTVLSFAIDALVRNIEHGFAWYRDLEGVATVARMGGTGLYPRERDVLRRITENLEDPMERLISDRMKAIFESLVKQYHSHFGLGPKGWDVARDKARTFAIKTQLNRAFNRQTILSALSRIYAESGNYVPFFTPDEYDWLLRRTAENPGEVRSLLIFACEVRAPKEHAATAPTDFDGSTAA